MIFDNFNNLRIYFGVSPFIERIDSIITVIMEGKFDFENPLVFDDGFKIIVISKEVKNDKTNYCLERHRLNIDFHYIVEGMDDIGLRNIEKCKNIYKPYNTVDDFELFNDEPEYRFKLLPGNFLIITPSYAHDTLLSKGFVKKIVFKMPIS
jgi:beta-galactosidase beta subunit